MLNYKDKIKGTEKYSGHATALRGSYRPKSKGFTVK
jgi:hypothetical protein